VPATTEYRLCVRAFRQRDARSCRRDRRRRYLHPPCARAPVLRGYAETMYRARSWSKPRRACARIAASSLGLDIRYVVTSLAAGSAEHVYDTLYCARDQAENLIKMHKGQLASDRTSCRSPDAPHPAHRCLLGSRCAMRSPRRTRSQNRSSPPSAYGSSSLRTGDRDRITHSPRLRCRLPRGRSHQGISPLPSVPQDRESQGRRRPVELSRKPTTRRKSLIHNALRTTQRSSAFSKNQPPTPARW
jgi:Transposase DDE domain group 1